MEFNLLYRSILLLVEKFLESVLSLLRRADYLFLSIVLTATWCDIFHNLQRVRGDIPFVLVASVKYNSPHLLLPILCSAIFLFELEAAVTAQIDIATFEFSHRLINEFAKPEQC